jgi:hypothetical protein
MYMTATQDAKLHDKTVPTTPLAQRSLGELVATLSRDLALLVHQEIELIKADLVSGLKRAGFGIAGFVVAAVAAILALPVLSVAAALGIRALGISLGWSFLIVAGAYLLIAAIAALYGIGQLKKAKPATRGVDSVKADLHAIARKPGTPLEDPANPTAKALEKKADKKAAS